MTQVDEPYLPEDKDILDALEAIGPMSTGTALAEQQRRLQVLQVQATLRNRKTANNLEKTTIWYSIVIAVFAMIQIVIMFSQLLFDTATSEHKYIALSVVVVCCVGVTLILKYLDPEKLMKK